MNKYNLLIFDVDGTLVEDYNSTALLPEAVKFFESLPKQGGPDIALVTNQGGVGLRYWMEQEGFGDPEKYPTQEQARSRILKVAAQIAELYRFPHVHIAWAYQAKSSGAWGPVPDDGDPEWSKEWRKPNAGMLKAAIKTTGASHNRTLMVGDRNEDKGAAAKALCDFEWAEVFFEEGSAY